MKTAARTTPVIAPPIVEFKRSIASALGGRDDVIDLSQALPSYAPPPPARDALRAAADDPSASRYTPDPGLDSLRERVAADLVRRHDASITADHVLITPGANSAFHTLAHAVVDPGDTVTLMTPYYFNHAMSVELLGGRVAEWRPAPAGLDGVLGPDTPMPAPPGGVLVVVNPGNPTGRALAPRELSVLDERCRAEDVRLVVDETYLEFHPIGRPPITLMSRDGWPEHAAVVGTYSKSLAMAGYRVGYIAAHPHVIAACLKVQDAQVVCAPRASQLAVEAALEWPDLDGWLSDRRREIGRRVEAFVDALAGSGAPLRVESAGAFFAYVVAGDRAPDLDAPTFARELATSAGVLVLPGSPFGSREGRALRVAVGNADIPDLIAAAARLSDLATRTLDR